MSVVLAYPLRHVRSFVRRKGRRTKTECKALENFWPKYGLSMGSEGVLDFTQVFGRISEVVVEIGFGDSQSLVQMAKNIPEKDFIGIDVYRTGVGRLLALLEKNALSNVRVFCADAVDVLEQKIAEHSLSRVNVFFPDPWPKSRHHKRRLVQPPFINLVAKKLRKGGIFHLATDWMDYAYQMLSQLSANVHFVNSEETQQFVTRPDFRPVTKYEQRGQRLGHQISDLIFKRTK